MASTPRATPELWQFLGAYLHQDWSIEFDDEWAALDRFIDDAPELASRLPIEIDRVLAEHPPEPDLRAFLVTQGCNYVPATEIGGYRGWLTEVSHRVEAALARNDQT